MGYETLAAKAGVNAHYIYEVDVTQYICQYAYRGMWINGNPSLHFQRFDLLNIPVEMWAGFIMHRQMICPRFFKGFCIFFRLHYHQVNIAGFFSGLPEKLNDHW